MSDKTIWNLGLLRVAETPALHCGALPTELAGLVSVASSRRVETESEYRLWLCLQLGWHIEVASEALDRAVEAARDLKGVDPGKVAMCDYEIVDRMVWFVGELEAMARDSDHSPVFVAADTINALLSILSLHDHGGYQKSDPGGPTRPAWTFIRPGFCLREQPAAEASLSNGSAVG